MITFACLDCRLALRTVGDPDEIDHLIGTRSDWYPNRYPCPHSVCRGMMSMVEVLDASDFTTQDLTPQECFQAFHGLGLPREKSCMPGDLQAALVGSKIIGIDVQSVKNDKRSVIHSILMDGGTRIYLASSPQGAMVYRIAQPRSVVKAVLGE